MTIELANKVCDWLRAAKPASGHHKDIRPVSVTIGKHTYYGARMTYVGVYTASMTACTHGDKKPGDTYEQDAIWLIGDRPEHKKKRTCYPFQNQEWYVSSYYDGGEKDDRFHPFGNCFGLRPWTSKGKIDDGERSPYHRLPITITSL